jgi:hypothetical protein
MAKGLPPERVVDPAEVKERARKLRRALQTALRMPDFQSCRADQLATYGKVLQTLEARLEELGTDMSRVRTPGPEIQRLRLTHRDWQRQIRYQREDLERFRRTALGEPVAAEEEQP